MSPKNISQCIICIKCFLNVIEFLLSRYVRLTNTEVDSSDNEYMSNIMPVVDSQGNVSNKPVGVAQLLHDGHGKSSPKFSHNTDRLPTTFCQPPGLPKHDRQGVDLVCMERWIVFCGL